MNVCVENTAELFCRSLDAVAGLKRFFEKNGLIVDSEMRDVFVGNIPKAIVTRKQKRIIKEQMKRVQADNEAWEPFKKHSNHLLKLSMINVEGESITWGKAETMIDASAEEVLAWFWHYCR